MGLAQDRNGNQIITQNEYVSVAKTNPTSLDLKNSTGPKKIFQLENFWGQKFLDTKFFSPKTIFWPKIFCLPKFYGTQNLSPDFINPKFFKFLPNVVDDLFR